MSLYEFFDSLFFNEFKLIFLKRKNDFSTSWEFFIFFRYNSESSSSIGLPSVLFIIIVFSDDSDLLGDEIGRVESYSELTNHTDISSGGNSFHERFGSRFGNSSQIIDQLSFSHTNTCIPDS